MTTAIPFAHRYETGTLPDHLHEIVGALEAGHPIYHSSRLRERLELLDTLDAIFGDFASQSFPSHANAQMQARARSLRLRLEAANAQLYHSIRVEMMRGALSQALLPWIQDSPRTGSKSRLTPGPGFDHRDEVLSGILGLREPSQPLAVKPEMVFYQPTPVRHILHLIRVGPITADEVFVDLGSGLGHVALLVSMLTGVKSIGIEIEPAYVACAQECAQRFDQVRVQFLHADARSADLSNGTVFYLYSPFTGSILADVLARLREESARRPIKVCTLGPCTTTIRKQSWLEPRTMPDPDTISVFQSCC